MKVLVQLSTNEDRFPDGVLAQVIEHQAGVTIGQASFEMPDGQYFSTKTKILSTSIDRLAGVGYI